MEKEITFRKEILFEGRIVKLELHDVKIGDKTSKREIVRHAKGVGVLCLDSSGRYLLVEQYRKPFDKTEMEIPAGKVEEGEDILLTAKRELREETGYAARSWKYLGEYLASPGFTDEVVYLYHAEDLYEDPLKGDEDENICIHKYSIEEVENLVEKGQIRDGKTLAALFYRMIRKC